MDKVRLGRALGYGTRHAAKTLAAVAEAAATPDPRARPRSTGVAAAPPKPAVSAARASTGAKHLGRSLWRPIAVFSNVLWLRVTGLFFALIAFAMGNGAWRVRAAVRGGAGAHRFWLLGVFAALFGYFAVSSFVRASQKERRAAAAP